MKFCPDSGVLRALSLLVLVLMWDTALARESCLGWKRPESDPSGGRYQLELQVCEVTYGLSAYVQVQNLSDKSLALDFVVVTGADTEKPASIRLEPGAVMRAGMCQKCAKKNEGYKHWDIVNIQLVLEDGTLAEFVEGAVPEEDAGDTEQTTESGAEDVAASTDDAADTETETAESGVVEQAAESVPEATTETVDKAAEETVAVEETAAAASEQSEAQDEISANEQQVTVEEASTELEVKEMEINYDDLPPEFRPRNN